MTQEKQRQRLVPQNLGWVDRLVRFMVGTALLVAGVTYLGIAVSNPVWLEEASVAGWPSWAIVVSIYPYLTAILGMDPVYRIFGFRTCGGSEKNPCGTLPYELESAKKGHPPKLKDPVDHSLESAGQTPSAKPHR